jgi:Ricin-type beta-trefoil lectin domain-like
MKILLLTTIQSCLLFFANVSFIVAQNPVPANTLQTTWMGNNFKGGNGKWVQNYISAVWVDKDGTVFTNSGWDEADAEAGFYKNGEMVGKMQNLHGWSRSGGRAIAGDDNYIYVATLQQPVASNVDISGWNPIQWPFPPAGQNWYHIRRYNKNGIFAPFSGSSAMMANRTDVSIRGCAVKGDTLYVTDINKVSLYNKSSNSASALLSSFNLPNASDIVVANDNSLWIVLEKTNTNVNPKIINCTNTGVFIREITTVVNPRGISLDNNGNLMVCEDGPLQQVFLFNINTTTPTLIKNIGDANGINGGTPGLRTPNKLNTPVDCGMDLNGNVYIGCTLNQIFDPVGNEFRDGTKLGSEIKAFSPTDNLLWNLYGLEFVGVGAADPATDAANMYTSDSHYTFDLTKADGQEWSYKANTIDKFKYPNDLRLLDENVCAKLKVINGQRFLFTIDMYTDKLIVYRFDGEIAVPTAIFTRGQHNYPTSPTVASNQRVIWIDQDADGQYDTNEFQIYAQRNPYMKGWYVDDKGTVWQSFRENGIEKYPIQSVVNGVPKWTSASLVYYTNPSEFIDVQRLVYDTLEDAMYLSGSTIAYPYNTSYWWGIAGRELIKYTNWSNPASRAIAFRIHLVDSLNAFDLNDRTKYRAITAIEMAGDYLFCGELLHKNITWVYKKSDGSFVGLLQPPIDYINENGWGLDTPYGLTAYRRTNGEYIVISEEDRYNKNIVFRWCPTGNCSNVLSSNDLVINGIYQLTPLHATSMRLNVVNSGNINATNVQIATANNSTAQQWKLLQGNDGYELAPLCAPQLRLDVQGANNANGTNVHIWQTNGSWAQQWKFSKVSDGIYELAPNCASGKRLDVYGYATTSGTNVHIWEDLNGANQRWLFTRVGSVSSTAQSAATIEVLPNPVVGNSFTIQLSTAIATSTSISFKLTSPNGASYSCTWKPINKNSCEITLKNPLAKGIYLLTAIVNREIYTEKLVVQ